MRDLKSLGTEIPCGFDSHLRYIKIKIMTKEEIITLIDSDLDMNSPEMKEFKKKVNSDPELKALVKEVKDENAVGMGDAEDIMYDAITVALESPSLDGLKDEQTKFGMLCQYLTMPSIIKNRMTGEQFDKISKMVNDFISTSTLPKDQTDKLIYFLDKLNNKLK